MVRPKAVISCYEEPGGMVGVEDAEHHLVSTVLKKDVVPRAGGCRGDVCVDEGQCGYLESSLNCQIFRSVIIEKYVTVRHPIGDGLVDESNKSSASGRAISPEPDSGIACELLER